MTEKDLEEVFKLLDEDYKEPRRKEFQKTVLREALKQSNSLIGQIEELEGKVKKVGSPEALDQLTTEFLRIYNKYHRGISKYQVNIQDLREEVREKLVEIWEEVLNKIAHFLNSDYARRLEITSWGLRPYGEAIISGIEITFRSVVDTY